MASSVRVGAVSRANARQVKQQSTARATPRARDVSPAESLASGMMAGRKRKERDFDEGDKETNIHVVVRCRGRTQREMKENSAIVVNTNGVKGTQIELCNGTNSLSNKTYSFDRVFSQAADQSMVYDDTIKPVLDEMLAGYNCTIFAYGQTGTGKTYTMSGDMADTMGMLSDEAGIVPRLLQQLFNKLEIEETENCVKCSFIELYNEELRDLLSTDDSVKLKIYDDAGRKGHASALVHGMEEKHIKTAAEGIKVLQDGSLKRQVAATNYNDRSSRSHTIFTLTAYSRKINDNGFEDLISAGKVNLVDLAGSENIQRSGAEHKRATEAGMINKSLLTLGRVINGLVDRSSHIPYRESKLTRLLQDSLGGRTKTCIIATISMAKNNLEETISTLDYAFRAKNIRNKPQLHIIPKKTLLRDFTSEIEKLKSELMSTRQRNGVYLSNEMYEEIIAQSESRRIAIDEQRAKMETLETNLRNKAQELFSLVTSFVGLKKEHEGMKTQLDETNGVLKQTSIILSATRKSLTEEKDLRKSYERTEEQLTKTGGELISKLHDTIDDITALHAKDKRKVELQSSNRTAWSISQTEVADVTSLVEDRVLELQERQRNYISNISECTEMFVIEELKTLSATQNVLDEQIGQLAESKDQLLDRMGKSKDSMDGVLQEIEGVCNTVQDSVGSSLQVVSQAAKSITADMLNKATEFHHQLQKSCSSLSKDFDSLFVDLLGHIATQRSESDDLRRQLRSATSAVTFQNAEISTRMQEALEKERLQAAEDRQKLLTQISNLVDQQAKTQEARQADLASQVQESFGESNASLERAVSQYGQGMDVWDVKESQLLEKVKGSSEQLQSKLQIDSTWAHRHSTSIQDAARSIQAKVQNVEEQTSDLGIHMEALKSFVTCGISDNVTLHETQVQSVRVSSGAVEHSLGNILRQVNIMFDLVNNLADKTHMGTNDFYGYIEPLKMQLCQPLTSLRESISKRALQEYQQTGSTPQKRLYQYPEKLPRTEKRDILIFQFDEDHQLAAVGPPEEESSNCRDDIAFTEQRNFGRTSPSPRQSNISVPNESHPGLSLSEANPNRMMTMPMSASISHQQASALSIKAENTKPSVGHSTWSSCSTGKKSIVIDGVENLHPMALPRSNSRRKSPRLK